MYRIVRHTVCTIGLWVIIAILGAVSAACTVPSASPGTAEPTAGGASVLEQDAPPTPELSTVQVDLEQAPPKEGKRSTQEDCPGVESQLVQIVQAPNALDLAQQLGFRAKDSKIQVPLVLAEPDTAFLKGSDVEVGTQSGNQVQAFVPIDRVCELASTEQVLVIRLPSGAAAQ